MFQEIIPMQDLVRYTKSSSISTSHVHLYDAESVPVACSIFKVYIHELFFSLEQSFFKSHKVDHVARDFFKKNYVNLNRKIQ